MSQDLAIFIKTLIEQTSKQNTIKEIDQLVTSLQNKLNNIKINIDISGLSQLTSKLNQVNNITQNIKAPRFNFDVQTQELLNFNKAIMNTESYIEATGRRVSTIKDELGKVTMEVVSATGYVEKYKYQWDSVDQVLVRINRDQKDSIGTIEALHSRFKGMINTLNNGKLGNFIDKSALQSFENGLKNIEVLDAKILNDLRNQFNQIKLNAQAMKESFNSTQNLDVYKSRMSNFIDTNSQKYGWQVDTSSLEQFKNQISQLNSNMPNLQNIMKSINQEVRNITNNIKLEAQELNKIISLESQINKQLQSEENKRKSLVEQIKLAQMSSNNSFAKFESSKLFGTLDSSSSTQYNNIKNSINSITSATPNAINELKLLGKQFDELKIKANQSFDLHTAEQKLNNYLIKMQGDITKFKKQFEGQFNTLKFDAFQQKALGLQIDPNSSNKTADLTEKIKALNTEFNSMKSEAYANGINAANKATMSFGESLNLILYKFSTWIAMSTVVMGAIHKVTESFDYMLEQTKLFTNLQMEMTNQNLKFNDVTQSALDFAKAMGTTSTEVMKAISVFGTYTSTMDQVLERSEAAIILSNISGRSILEVSDDLMAAQTQFKLGSNQLIDIVNTYASVARNLQVDFPKALGEISSGLKYVGSVAAEAKMPITDLIATEGTLIEVLRRSGSQISNGLKTIFSRIGNVGEEVNPEEFKGIEKTFYKMGISIKDSAETIKPMNQILKETAERWKTLNDVQRQELATNAANIYQRNVFIAMMNNYDKILQNTESAYNSEGVAMQKQDIYMKSLYASLQKLQNAWEKLYNSTISSSMWKYSADGITSVMDGFNNLAEIIGGFPALMGAAVASFALFSSKMRNNMSGILGSVQPSNYVSWNKGQQGPQPPANLSGGLKTQIPIWDNLTKAVSNYNTKLQGAKLYNEQILGQRGMYQGLYNHWTALTTSVNRYTTGVITARVATVALQTISTIGLTVAFSMAVGWVFKYVDGLIHAKEKQKELFESLKNDVDTLNSEFSNSEKLIKTYNNLSQATSLTAEEKEKLADVTEKLSALYPSSIENMSAEGTAISLSSEKLQEYIDLKEQQLELKRSGLSEQFYKTGDDNVNDLLINEKNIKSKMEQLAEYEKNQKRFLDSGDAKTDKTGYKKVLEDINRTKKEILELKSESIKTIDELKTGLKATLQSEDGFKNLKPKELDNFISSLLKSQDVLEQIKKSGNIEIFSASLIDNGFADTFSQINKEFNDLSNNTNITQKDIDDFNNNAVSKLTEKLGYLGLGADDVAKTIAEKFSLSVKEAKEEIVDFASMLSDVQSQLSDSAEIIKPIKSALDEYNETGQFNIDTLISLAEKHTELIPILGDEEAVHQALIDIMQKEQDKSKEVYINMLMNSEDFYNKNILLNTSLVKELNNKYSIDLNNFKNLANAKKAIESNLIGELAKKWSDYYGVQGFKNDVYEFKMNPKTKELYIADKKTGKFVTDDQEIIKSYGQLQKDNADLASSFRKIAEESSNMTSVDFSQLGVDANKNKEATNDLTDATKEYKNSVDSLNNTLNKLRNDREKMIVGSKEYLDSLHDENEAIREREKLLKNQIGSQPTYTSNYSTSNGKLPNPIPGTQLKDSFGAPRDGGARKHEGIDIMANRGTEIHSTTSGKVLRAGNSGSKGGWAVTISDPQGNSHYYAHMNTDPSKILGIGQEILAGQVIGYVGDSGNAKGTPHLHYGITDANKKAINPYNLLTNDVNTQKTTTVNTSQSAINKYGISPEIVNTVLSLAQKYNVDPALILAIGEQETNWGKSGDGKNGMYTGYKSYDSGSDYTAAGLETQVEGTVKKMLAWGMTPGNVSFDRLNQGNKGNLPTDLYATDQNWQNSVWSLYKEFSNGQMTTSASTEAMRDAQNKQDALNNDIIAEQQKLAEQREKNSLEWWQAHWTKYDADMQDIQDERNFVKAKSDTLSPISQDYRDNLQLQVDSMKEEQDKLHESAELAREAMNSPVYKDNPRALKELQDMVEKYSATWWSLQKEINDTSFEKITSKIEEFDNAISDLNNNTANLESELSMLEKGTTLYNNKLKDVVISHKEEQLALQNKRNYLESQLLSIQKGTIAYEELKQKLQEVVSAEIDAKKALYDISNQLADDIISIYKDTYEKQKDYALDAIDEQMKAEDKRHDQATKNLDDEMQQFEDSINEKLDILNKQENQEDYTKNLSNLQKEESDIQKQINVLALDDSYEANAKRIELQKELTSKQEEIEKLQLDHSRELRKENLNDQLDEYKKDNDAKKELEDDKYDTIKDSLDDQKDITEKYYENLINDERKFAKIREDIIKGNFSNIQSELSNFESIASSKFKSLGTNIQTNFIDQIRNALSALKSLNDANGSDIGGNSGNSDSNNNSGSNSNTHSQYYPWKSQINNIIYDKKMWQQGYETGNQQMMKDAENEAKIYYDQIPDDAKSLLQGMNYTSAKSWYDKNIYHEGDVVGGSKKGSKIANLIDKIFNKGQNEQIAKLLNGEVVLSNNAVKNFIPNMQNYVNSIMPSLNLVNANTETTGNTNHYNINLNIASLNGNKKSADYLYTEIRKNLNKIGK